MYETERAALVARLTELERQNRQRKMSNEDQRSWDQTVDAVQKLDAGHARDMKRVTDALAAGHIENGTMFGNRDATRVPGNPWEARSRETGQETRSRALTAIEQWTADDNIRQSATRVLEAVEGDEIGNLAEAALRFSDPLYISAWRKYVRDPEGYASGFSEEERRVWQSNRVYARATLQTSGAVLPAPLDPAWNIQNPSVEGDLRSIARVVAVTAKEQRFIVTPGSAFSYDNELEEVSDDSSTLAEVTIENFKAQGYIVASLEAAADQPGFDSEIARVIADGKANLEGDKFVNGSGTGEPYGCAKQLIDDSAISTAVGEALAAGDVYTAIEALSPRYRNSSTWLLEQSTRNFIYRLYNPQGSEPPLIEGNTLIGRPFQINSSIDPYSGVLASETADNYCLLVGSFDRYVITERVGMSVFYIPPGVIINAANHRPDGRVGWYAVWRNGAGWLDDGAGNIDSGLVVNVHTAA